MDITTFWTRVRQGAPNECWKWRGAVSVGYGSLRFGGRTRYAHHVSYELAQGVPPAGAQVRHRCRNRLCVNPAHLFLGLTAKTVGDMFWDFVRKGAPDECWEWQGAQYGRGYGSVGGHASAHRTAYELTHGSIPKGMDVLHSCDNPPCVNPAHLFVGDATRNAQDMVSKGRGRNRPQRGSANGNSKLVESQVIDIRHLRAQGKTLEAIAGKYGIAACTVSAIMHGRSWRYLS